MLIPPKATLFISDLHLSAKTPALTKLFLNFLENAKTARALYILGDLFNTWLGEDIHATFQTGIQKALKKLAGHGVSLFFMKGNRDFLISSSFLKEAQCHLLSDPTLISLYGKSTLLTHGDILCTHDKTYQRYRKIAQHPFSRTLFLSLPKSIRQKIGDGLRRKSHHYQRQQATHILDVTPATVKNLMQRYQVTQLIHGHVHKPCIHPLTLNNQTAQRVVLGDWQPNKGSLIISTPTLLSLTTFSPFS